MPSKPMGKARAKPKTPPKVPALEEHEKIDLALRQMGRRLGQSFLDAAALIHRARESRYYQRFGFEDVLKYAESRLQVSYRTLARWLACWEAVLRVSEPEQEEVKAAFAEIGSHKSGVLAPAVGHPEADWRQLAEFAKKATEEGLQERVSAETGRARTPAGDEPGAKFYRFLLNNCPPEAKDLIEQTFEMGFKICGSKNSWAVLIALCEEQAPDWLERVEKGVE
jgi:hypothetical protein